MEIAVEATDDVDEQFLLELDEALEAQNRDDTAGFLHQQHPTSTPQEASTSSPVPGCSAWATTEVYPASRKVAGGLAISRHQSGGCHLAFVPKEVLFRVFSFLSAADLFTCAEVSRQFLRMALEDTLWRRLYCARWGQSTDVSDTGATWKVKYVDRDADEMRKTVASAPEGQEDLYVQMQVARREQSLGRSAVEDMAELTSPEGRQVNAWLREHGFQASCSSQRPASITSPDLHFVRIGASTYACEETGWLHVCDDGCRERIPDPTTGLLVCPISGQEFDRMMSECEVEAWCGGGPGGRKEDGLEDEWGERGRLAQAYYAGYYCRDETELRRLCGVKLR